MRTILTACILLVGSIIHAQENTTATAAPTEREFISFRDGNPFENGVVVDDGRALRIDKGYLVLNRKLDWSGYDFLKIDMDLDAKEPLDFYMEIHDAQTKGYWTRVNYNTIIPPGKSTFIVPLRQLFVGEKSRPGPNLLLDKITRFILNVGDNPSGPLTISRLRLEKDTTAAEISFDGLYAFDFGSKTSPVMESFTQVTPETRYEKESGFGFVRNDGLRAFDARQPEPLYQDFILLWSNEFAVDMPNGKYRVMVNLDCPGGFWGENQVYQKRTIKANGKTVLEETLDFDGYNKHYYRFWNLDDMPWENTFDKYQKTTFHEKYFDTEVTDGQLKIGFEGDDWGCCLSAIVIYPAEKSTQGEKFLRFAEEKRRFHFDNYFKRVLPTPSGDPLQPNDTDKKRGFVAFQRDFMQEVNYNGTPRKEEILTELKASAFAGEYEPITLSLVPLQHLGKVTVTASEWTGPSGAVIPASAIDIGYVSYRLSRVTMEGTVYTIAPRMIMPLNSVEIKEGITRRFWLTVKTPQDCAPGLYNGKLAVRAENGGTAEIPVKFLVRKGNLDAIDIPAGPFGHAVHTSWRKDAKGDAFSQLLLDNSLRKLREYGFNCATGLPRINYRGFKDGKPVLDYRSADSDMKLLKELGFTAFVAYGGGLGGFSPYYKDDDAMKSAGFDDYSLFIRAIYSEIEKHAESNGWIPLYFYLADEPIGDDLIRSAENAEEYRKAFPQGPPYFSGASSFTGGNAEDPHFRLAKAFHIVSWNGHDEKGTRLLQKAGGQWAFYNDGNRWTFGDYMFKCVREFDMKFRVSWHFNACAGNPYYALDCREDDYAWCNSSPDGNLIPSLDFERTREGIEDYRRLQTLERLAKEKQDQDGLNVIENRMQSFRFGQRNHDRIFPVTDWKDSRKKVDDAIEKLR